MIEKIKNLRVQIDGYSQLVKSLKPNPGATDEGQNSYEIWKCHESLILGKAWLGKVLGELGNPTPYQNDGKRTDINSIEKTADTGNPVEQMGPSTFDYEKKNHIEKVDFLRQEIDKLVESLSRRMGRTLNQLHEKHFNYNIWNAINQSYNHLSEARFWLGFELQRIKENN